MQLVFAGSGEFGLPTLQSLLADGHEIVRIFTQPDRPAGRGRKLTPTAIGQFAQAHLLPLVPTADINAETHVPCDAMIVIAFGQKIAQTVADAPRLGSVNLHASLLPRYRGAAPIHWAILNGEQFTGNSVIRLAPRMDAGDILAQSQLEIAPLETTGELHDRLAEDGATLILRALRELASGASLPRAQDEAGVRLAPKLSRGDAIIDWALPATEIALRIRALYPWPACRVELRDADAQPLDRITLVRARAVPRAPGGNAQGHIATGGIIATGDDAFALEIVELQPQGKRPMSLADYARGHSWLPGMRVVSVT